MLISQLICYVSIVCLTASGTLQVYGSGEEQEASMQMAQAAISILAYVASIFGLVGMFYRKRWARHVYTLSLISLLIIAFKTGGVSTVDSMLLAINNVEQMLHGGIFMFAWFTPTEYDFQYMDFIKRKKAAAPTTGS
jgi:hypothetical protein